MARNQKQQRDASELQERVVYIHRVSKTVKGGRRMSLVALVVVGDRLRAPRRPWRVWCRPRSHQAGH